jgi:hypothetical protein
MTLFHSHPERLHGSVGANRLPISRAIKRVGDAFKMIHRAIAAAKIRRLRNELLLHADSYENWTRTRCHEGRVEKDGTRFPQRPLVLGDKWDF